MKRSFLTFLALAAVLGFAPTALADTIYTFSFTSTSEEFPEAGLLNGSGWLEISGGPLTGSPWLTPGLEGYNVVAGGMGFNGTAFSIVPNGDPGYPFHIDHEFLGDQVLYPGAASAFVLDNFGLDFVADDGSGDSIGLFGLYYPSYSYDIPLNEAYVIGESGPPDPRSGNEVSIYGAYGAFTLTPDPPTWWLMGTGLLGLVTLLLVGRVIPRCAE
jgi:hypothetical protein